MSSDAESRKAEIEADIIATRAELAQTADALRFATISDIPAEELGQFESLYRQSANLNQPR